jgi:hypothetical protein
MPRRRFGHYEVIDFLAILFGYAISGERTLEAFYPRDAQQDALVMEVSSQAHFMLRLFAGKGSEKSLLNENGRAAKNALKPNYC